MPRIEGIGSLPGGSGTFATVTSGQTKGASTILPDQWGSDLIADVTVLAETNTLTISGKWQGSADGTNWVDVIPYNNAALVALATGTSGSDSAVGPKGLPAPPGIASYRYARAAFVLGGTNGAAQDTWAVTYRFQRPQLT